MVLNSRTARAFGLIRSMAIYHAVPLRQRRLRCLYGKLVEPGDLVFDLGAHVGNRTRALANLGCRVVALEPQPDFARLLRRLFARRTNVEIIEAAVGGKAGQASLSVSDLTPTMTTLATRWRNERALDPSFASINWNRDIDVDMTTLDSLIERFGKPAFIKLDVEGAEPLVLAGLSQGVKVLSFEYLPNALSYVWACLARLNTLGPYLFNWSPGESYKLAADPWMTSKELTIALESTSARNRSGDVYARLI